MADLIYPNTPCDTTPTEGVITSNPFFPNVEPKDFREIMRVNNTITAQRVRFALVEGITFVNAQLRELRQAAQKMGINILSEAVEHVKDEDVDGEPVANHYYKRAVYSNAKAYLVEFFQDWDSTGKEPQDKSEIADNYRSDMNNAIADIKGDSRARVALV